MPWGRAGLGDYADSVAGSQEKTGSLLLYVQPQLMKVLGWTLVCPGSTSHGTLKDWVSVGKGSQHCAGCDNVERCRGPQFQSQPQCCGLVIAMGSWIKENWLNFPPAPPAGYLGLQMEADDRMKRVQSWLISAIVKIKSSLLITNDPVLLTAIYVLIYAFVDFLDLLLCALTLIFLI
jgi:hypothetical protein